MKYAFACSLIGEYAITKMCRWLEVSRSGFYRWRNREPSKRDLQRACVTKAVIETYHEYNQKYGAPRIVVELNENHIPCSLNHVAEIMQERGLKARNGKRFKYQPSPEAMSQVADNLLNRNFKASAPNEKWVSDITYIRAGDSWVYLAVIIDLYSRQVVGWAMDEHMKVDLILDAFNMAKAKRKVMPGLILHSDRGVQYRSWEYQQALESSEIKPSMSRKGNCWDNAVAESFFSRLKVEQVYAEDYETFGDAYQSVFDYIELFYNRVRRHSAINYKSPHEHEQLYYAQCA